MLKKLLKYDLQAIFKYWWVGATASITFSIIGAICDYIYNYGDGRLPDFIDAFLIIASIASYLGIVAFIMMSFILLYVRVYKNQFSDEGYLTFTLPVKRITHLNTKLFAGIITIISTALVTMFNLLIRYFIMYPEDFPANITINGTIEYIKTINVQCGGILPFYVIEAILGIFVIAAAISIFIYFCITVSGLIIKKGKVFVTISIFFVSAIIFILLLFIVWWFGISNIYKFLFYNNQPNVLLSLIIFAGILILSIFTAIFYALEYWLLQKKLNLN